MAERHHSPSGDTPHSSSDDPATPDDETEVQYALSTPVQHVADTMVEMAQILHFCATFKKPLKLPVFSRWDLQKALEEASQDGGTQNALLAELHFKLAREQITVKLDKMIHDWERVVARKVAENWMLSFPVNPLADATYAQLTMQQRVAILSALCNWKAESCLEIKKYIAAMQKDQPDSVVDALRATSIGTDDRGVSYWYLHDGCWIYAEDLPTWQREPRSPYYAVEYADAKRIRMSIDFAWGEDDSEPLDYLPTIEEDEEPTAVKQEETNSVGCETSRPATEDEETTMKEQDKTVKEEDAIIKKEQQVKEEEHHIKDEAEAVAPVEDLKEEKTEAATDPTKEPTAPGDGHEQTTVSMVGTKKRMIIDDDSSESDDEESETKRKRKKSSGESPSRAAKKQKTTNDDHDKKPADQDEPKAQEARSEPKPDETVEDNFNILCASCKKSYDMRYLDPPLSERPAGEWRCFECLVNDARGWPRRRRALISKPSKQTDEEEKKKKKTSSSSKRRSSTASSSKSKSKSKSSSSKLSKSSSKKKKKKKSSSSSSSSKKHKKKKSSSSHGDHHQYHHSSHHHSSRHHHKRRYHHEFEQLLGCHQKRKRERMAIERTRMMAVQTPLEGPHGWRVVCSTMDGLRQFIASLVGGSLTQERLRGKLISILKTQEKQEEERRKQQELAWQILPRRQSSRIAIEKLKNQTAGDSEEEEEDLEGGSRRRSLRSRRSENGHIGYDSKERLALERASRARRRQRYAEDSDEEEDEASVGNLVPVADGWIDWAKLKDERRKLSTVCLAIVDRLLKEQIADLFSRPVNPELDGCPDYLQVVEHPIDLGTIRSRLDQGFYTTWSVFKMDVERVWENCRSYNAKETLVVQFAETLEGMFLSMAINAEKHGARRMKDKLPKDDGDSSDEEENLSDASKAESQGSVTKAWSQSESSDDGSGSSDDGSSSESEQDSDSRSRKATKRMKEKPSASTRGRAAPVKKPASVPKKKRTKRKAYDSEEESESSSEEDSEDSDAMGRRKTRKPRPSPARPGRNRSNRNVIQDDDDEEDDHVMKSPPPAPPSAPPSAPSSPPPPPAPKDKKPKAEESDSSSSSGGDSSDSDDASMDSGDSDAEGHAAAAPPSSSSKSQPPPPASPPAAAPPPPPPSSSSRSKPSNKKTVKASARSYATASPSLLNPVMSPSSSSSYFSSEDDDDEDDSSDADSD